jgi:hypothetical protein
MEPGGGLRWRLLAEAFRAWVPIVISICAISLTVFQAMHARRHTKLSVQPRLDWRVEQDVSTGTVTFSLINVGFGPAVLTEVSLYFGDEDLGPAGAEACAGMDRRLGRDGDAWDTRCFAMQGEYVLRPGDSVLLYGSRPAAAGTAGDERVAAVDIGKVSADARYCSFYEDCWRLRDT